MAADADAEEEGKEMPTLELDCYLMVLGLEGAGFKGLWFESEGFGARGCVFCVWVGAGSGCFRA